MEENSIKLPNIAQKMIFKKFGKQIKGQGIKTQVTELGNKMVKLDKAATLLEDCRERGRKYG